MQIDFFRCTRPCIKVKCEIAVRIQHLVDCEPQRRWVKLWLVGGKHFIASSSVFTLVVCLLFDLFFLLQNNEPVTKPQSTTQDVIGRRGRTCPRNEPLHILWRKRKVLHLPLSRDVTDEGQSAPVTCMFVYKIKNWNVWACPFATQSVTGWGTGGVFALNVAFLFTTAGAVWRPKKSCKLSLKYEINNENNIAVVATFGRRSRNEVLSVT